MNWSADSIHFVLYSPGRSEPFDATEIWKSLFSGRPSSYQSNPPGLPPGELAIGEVAGKKVIVVTALGRAELALAAPDSPTPTFVALANPAEALKDILVYAYKLLEIEQATRLAVVCKLLRNFANAPEAAKAFANFTGISIAPPEALELTFRANVPGSFADGTGMNRIGKCETAVRNLMFMTQHPGGVMGSPMNISKNVMAFEIDVNSVDSDVNLSREQSRILLAELAEEAQAILSKGYGYVLHPHN